MDHLVLTPHLSFPLPGKIRGLGFCSLPKILKSIHFSSIDSSKLVLFNTPHLQWPTTILTSSTNSSSSHRLRRRSIFVSNRQMQISWGAHRHLSNNRNRRHRWFATLPLPPLTSIPTSTTPLLPPVGPLHITMVHFKTFLTFKFYSCGFYTLLYLGMWSQFSLWECTNHKAAFLVLPILII